MLIEQSFTVGEACRASGVGERTFQNWIRRGLIAAESDDMTGGGSPGRYRRLSGRVVMHLAIARALIDGGLGGNSPAAALDAAAGFAFHGIEDRLGKYIFKGRVPGMPFAERTLFAVCGEKTAAVPDTDPGAARLICSTMKAPLIVDATLVFAQVCGGLGAHPASELAAAYGEEVTE